MRQKDRPEVWQRDELYRPAVAAGPRVDDRASVSYIRGPSTWSLT